MYIYIYILYLILTKAAQPVCFVCVRACVFLLVLSVIQPHEQQIKEGQTFNRGIYMSLCGQLSFQF